MPKKSKKNIKKNPEPQMQRELELKENMEEYGKIISLLGDRRVTVRFPDGSEKLGHIPKRLKRQRCYVKLDDVVLVGFREFQEDKVDVLHRYKPDEIKKLIQYGELPDSFERSTFSSVTDGNDGNDGNDVIFEEEDFDDI